MSDTGPPDRGNLFRFASADKLPRTKRPPAAVAGVALRNERDAGAPSSAEMVTNSIGGECGNIGNRTSRGWNQRSDACEVSFSAGFFYWKRKKSSTTETIMPAAADDTQHHQ